MATIYFIFLVSLTPPDSVEPCYYDYKFREIIIEAPWVVGIDDTINFLFYMHDCDDNPLEELTYLHLRSGKMRLTKSSVNFNW